MDNGASSYRRFLDGDESGIAELIKDYKDGLMLYLNGYVQNIHIAVDYLRHDANQRPTDPEELAWMRQDEADAELFVEDGECRYYVNLYGFTEGPTDEWLASFGLTSFIDE